MDAALGPKTSYCPCERAVVRYGGAKNELRLYHEMSMPPGLLVVGDSAMQLNPTYAQASEDEVLGF